MKELKLVDEKNEDTGVKKEDVEAVVHGGQVELNPD